MAANQACGRGLVTLPENTKGRDFVAGDLHGQYTLLMNQLDDVDFDEAVDRLLLVGDLIDRGPESFDCLHLPYRPWCFSVLGNHELMMLQAMIGQESEAVIGWFQNGGQWVLNEDWDDLLCVAKDLVANLPLALEVPCQERRLGLIHAGVTSGVWGEFDALRDVWTRDLMKPTHDWYVPDDPVVEGIDAVAVGHTIREGVTLRGNVVGMDVGAARGKAPEVWEVCALLEAVESHQRSGRVTTEFKPLLSDRTVHGF